MKRTLSFPVLTALLCAAAGAVTLTASASQPRPAGKHAAPTGASETPVYAAGTQGYKSFRIPSLLVTKKGTLLAFCEGRRNNGRDYGDIDLLLRRSMDGGKTWTSAQAVWDDGDNTCGNPCPILDEQTGDIVLLMTHNLGTDIQKAITDGTSKETRTVWITRSSDDGVTWSKPEDITAQVKRPDWRWYATGPGIGIQMQHGPHKGRMVVPCDHSEADKTGWSHTIYSDDAGKTWKIGGVCPEQHTDECQVAELPDGTLLLNMRAAVPKAQSRAVCKSTDGGEHWTDFHHDPVLIESRCQGSLISATEQGKPILLFSNPADTRPKSRTAMTVRLSRDNGTTWPQSVVLHPGFAAYSCLAALPNGEISCLYERGDAKGYETITFARFPLSLLTSSARSQ